MKYGIEWLAWTAAVFLWLSLIAYARKHLISNPKLRYVLPAALALIIGVLTYGLTNQNQKPSTEAAQQKQEPSVQQSNQGNGNTNFNAPNNQGVITVITGSDPKVKPQLDRIEKLLKDKQNTLAPDKLLAEYPLGYVIFDISDQKTLFPYQTKGELAQWNIDWDAFRYSEKSGPHGEMVDVKIPDIRYSAGNSQFVVTGVSLSCPKRVGGLCGGGTIVRNGSIGMFAEILSISPKGTVFLFGFKRIS